MDSKLEKLTKEAEGLGIKLDANETIADLEGKISFAKQKIKQKKEQPKAPKRGRAIKNKTFTRRINREAKDNGTS